MQAVGAGSLVVRTEAEVKRSSEQTISTKTNGLSKIPDLLVFRILGFLDTVETARFSGVNKRVCYLTSGAGITSWQGSSLVHLKYSALLRAPQRNLGILGDTDEHLNFAVSLSGVTANNVWWYHHDFSTYCFTNRSGDHPTTAKVFDHKMVVKSTEVLGEARNLMALQFSFSYKKIYVVDRDTGVQETEIDIEQATKKEALARRVALARMGRVDTNSNYCCPTVGCFIWPGKRVVAILGDGLIGLWEKIDKTYQCTAINRFAGIQEERDCFCRIEDTVYAFTASKTNWDGINLRDLSSIEMPKFPYAPTFGNYSTMHSNSTTLFIASGAGEAFAYEHIKDSSPSLKYKWSYNVPDHKLTTLACNDKWLILKIKNAANDTWVSASDATDGKRKWVQYVGRPSKCRASLHDQDVVAVNIGNKVLFQHLPHNRLPSIVVPGVSDIIDVHLSIADRELLVCTSKVDGKVMENRLYRCTLEAPKAV
jgi:hypothetical protein